MQAESLGKAYIKEIELFGPQIPEIRTGKLFKRNFNEPIFLQKPWPGIGKLLSPFFNKCLECLFS
jgi:hypothetical protein